MKRGLARAQRRTNYPKREADGVPGAKTKGQDKYTPSEKTVLFFKIV